MKRSKIEGGRLIFIEETGVVAARALHQTETPPQEMGL